MNSLFFWIIILSFLIPMAMRYYKKSMRGRNQDQGMPGGYPGQFGQFPGDAPGNYPGQQNKQPRDGFTQRDYYGAFGQLGAPQQPAPRQTSRTASRTPASSSRASSRTRGSRTSPRSPTRTAPTTRPTGPRTASSSTASPAGRPAPRFPRRRQAAPQGFRARKLAELDQRYSDGDLTMEDYMAQRAEIMKG